MSGTRSSLDSEVTAAASQDHESIVDLTSRLVRIPSQATIDPYGPIVGELHRWLANRGLHPDKLHDGAETVGVVCEIAGGQPGPRWVLNACVDTAPIGNLASWSYPPTEATVADGWLYGRGAADSKTGAAIFCHVAARVAAHADRLRGRLILLLDADEHSGRFGGARRYFAELDGPGDVAGAYIGYPGLDKLVVGSRGVVRYCLSVHGVAAHSGAKAATVSNAAVKATEVVRALTRLELPPASSSGFPLPPKLTVTAINGGEGYSTVPDLCTVQVDVRTTPGFDADAAYQLVAQAAAKVDAAWPATTPTQLAADTSWPPYVLPEQDPLRVALLAATEALGLAVRPKISGPSNIGNYLAGLGIPATAGFGVAYHDLHAADERIDLATIPLVQSAYHAAVLDLLAA